jgi:hypothetical protein
LSAERLEVNLWHVTDDGVMVIRGEPTYRPAHNVDLVARTFTTR